VGDGQEQPGGFCVVANVAEETAQGEGGLELRRGARHFAAGAKVRVLPPQWGDDGDQLIVAGHHRGARGRGLARMVISRRHLAGFRVQGIFSPAVLRALSRPLTELGRDHPPRLRSSRAEAEQAAASWRDPVGAVGRRIVDPQQRRLGYRGAELPACGAIRIAEADADPVPRDRGVRPAAGPAARGIAWGAISRRPLGLW
jgi:hypothetical protein